ncbi:hypothetical protein ABBQ38_005963 [Trebouxia sp. C0009 RCD-2024]
MTLPDRPSWFSEPCFLGIDEAGRGPVLGPMVYACAFAPIAYRDTVGKQAYADSKTLTEDKRENLFEAIQQDSQISFLFDVLSAADISMSMLSRDRLSLNTLANESTFKLLDSALQNNVNLQEVFVDTVGDAAKWQSRLEGKFPGIRFVVCPKADSLYPIVSAASIVAKVTRDRLLRDSRAPESGGTGSTEYGSGYPGDPVTTAWLKSSVDGVFGYPALVRFSWQTTTRMLEDTSCAVHWEHEADDPGQLTLDFSAAVPGRDRESKQQTSKGSSSQTQPPPVASSGKNRHSYFRARKLQRLCQPV